MSTATAPVPDERPTIVRYKVMAFLCVLSFLTYFDRVCIVRAKQDIKADLNLSDQEMGWILGAFWLAYALFEIPGGWMGDRYGARGTLTRIVLAWSLFTALSGSAWGFFSLLAFRFLFGMGEAGAYPNMARVQAHWLPVQSRAKAGGLLWLLARWGGAFSPLIFGSLLVFFASAGFRETIRAIPLLSGLADMAPWRWSFWFAGLLGSFWCVAFFLWFRDDPAQKKGVNAAELALIRSGRKPPEKHSMSRENWAALFKSRSLWAIGVLYICYSFGWSFFVSWVPEYFEKIHGQKFEQSEISQGLPLFFGGISCLVGGTLSDYLVRRTGKKWLYRAVFPLTGYTIAAVCMFSIQFVQTPTQATVLMCIAAAMGDFAQGANWATVVDIGGLYAGTAMGFINMVGNAGNYIQPPVGAWVFHSFGWNALFVVYAVMFLIAASMWFLVDPTKRFYKESNRVLCRECGYDLTGNTSGKCPECGAMMV